MRNVTTTGTCFVFVRGFASDFVIFEDVVVDVIVVVIALAVDLFSLDIPVIEGAGSALHSVWSLLLPDAREFDGAAFEDG